MPWIEFVTVKTATAADSAAPRPLAEARADRTAGARRAVENLRAGRVSSMRVTMPLTAGVKAVPPASLAPLKGIPGILYADSTFIFRADSLRHAYDLIERVVSLATGGYASLLRRATRDHPAGAEIMTAFTEQLLKTWFDYESGRWAPPPPAGAASAPGAPGTPATTPRKHHGYR
jgi:hypothetical protein